MEQTGEYRIAAGREEVWAALNDPDVLARCLDGCESMEKLGDDRFDARVKARVGPVRATFDAELALEDIEPLEHYTIKASVKGGPAGFARGQARVNLSGEGGETLLAYTVTASIGGKLAQVGSRLIDGAARKMADDFFARFRDQLAGPATAADPASGESLSEASVAAVGTMADSSRVQQPAADTPAGREPVPYESRGTWMIWAVVFVALLLALLFAI